MNTKSQTVVALLMLVSSAQAAAPFASRSTFPRYANNPAPAGSAATYKNNGYQCLREGYYWQYPHSKMTQSFWETAAQFASHVEYSHVGVDYENFGVPPQEYSPELSGSGFSPFLNRAGADYNSTSRERTIRQMNGTHHQLEDDYHNYTLAGDKTPEEDNYAQSGNDCTAQPNQLSWNDQYYITMDEGANTVSQFQYQAYNVSKDWVLPSQWQVSWDNLRWTAENEDAQYARDNTQQWCDQHITKLLRGDQQELASGYDMWGPSKKCTYFIQSEGNGGGEENAAPTFRIKDVHTGAAYNPEVWDFDLHYIEYDEDQMTGNHMDDDAHFVENVPTYTYTYCKDEVRNYHRYYNVMGSIVKTNSGTISLYTGLNDRSVDRTDGGYVAEDPSTWVHYQTDETNDDDDWTDDADDGVANLPPVYEGQDGYCDEYLDAITGHDDCQAGGACTLDERNIKDSPVGKFYNIRPWSGSVTPTYTSWDGSSNPTYLTKMNPIYRKSGMNFNEDQYVDMIEDDEDETVVPIDYISDEVVDLDDGDNYMSRNRQRPAGLYQAGDIYPDIRATNMLITMVNQINWYPENIDIRSNQNGVRDPWMMEYKIAGHNGGTWFKKSVAAVKADYETYDRIAADYVTLRDEYETLRDAYNDAQVTEAARLTDAFESIFTEAPSLPDRPCRPNSPPDYTGYYINSQNITSINDAGRNALEQVLPNEPLAGMWARNSDVTDAEVQVWHQDDDPRIVESETRVNFMTGFLVPNPDKDAVAYDLSVAGHAYGTVGQTIDSMPAGGFAYSNPTLDTGVPLDVDDIATWVYKRTMIVSILPNNAEYVSNADTEIILEVGTADWMTIAPLDDMTIDNTVLQIPTLRDRPETPALALSPEDALTVNSASADAAGATYMQAGAVAMMAIFAAGM